MHSDFHVIIPARYHSTRFPKKLLMDLHGMSVIERVYRQALLAQPQSVTIATDHPEIFKLAKEFGASVMMTQTSHQTGTDRIAEVVKELKFSAEDIIVNVQGDEPLIPPKLITQLAHLLGSIDEPMASLCWPVEDYATCVNPNVVKVVRDRAHNALYFSRSVIPAHRDAQQSIQHVFKHIGLYAYRASFLLTMVNWPVCDLESAEAIEALRVLWMGYKIRIEQACVQPMQDINTPIDLEHARIACAKIAQKQETA